jgi:hypothetical protein
MLAPLKRTNPPALVVLDWSASHHSLRLKSETTVFRVCAKINSDIKAAQTQNA